MGKLKIQISIWIGSRKGVKRKMIRSHRRIIRRCLRRKKVLGSSRPSGGMVASRPIA